MATIDDFWAQLWAAIVPTVARNPDGGIYKAWQEHYAEWGSPLADEGQDENGTPTQTFANAIVRWTDQGAEVVTGGG